MKEFNFYYGNGKTSQICIEAYNCKRRNDSFIIMNADYNKPVISNFEEEKNHPLRIAVDVLIDKDNLFGKILNLKDKNISTIFVDNAHFLNVEQVEQLFFVAKALNIKVNCYGDRMINQMTSLGSIRAMELATKIEPVDGIVNHAKDPRLQFYYGVMGCSKTAKLLIKAKKFEIEGFKIHIIKPISDRDPFMIKSRTGLSRKADCVLEPNDRINGSLLCDKGVDYVLVDEAPFLTEEQISDLHHISKQCGIPVECYGLKVNFMTYAFEGGRKLLQIADDLVKLESVCKCGNEAILNSRLNQFGNYLNEGEEIITDDGKVKADGNRYTYEELCEKEYIEKVWGLNIHDPQEVLRFLEQRKLLSRY